LGLDPGLYRGAVTNAAMGPLLVVVPPVILDEDASFGDTEHEFPIQAFTAIRDIRIPVEDVDRLLKSPPQH
jgi:hypothetical protein